MTGVTTDVGGDLSKSETAPHFCAADQPRFIYEAKIFFPKLFTMSVGVCIIELSAINH